jgi:cell division protein FtsL
MGRFDAEECEPEQLYAAQLHPGQLGTRQVRIPRSDIEDPSTEVEEVSIEKSRTGDSGTEQSGGAHSGIGRAGSGAAGVRQAGTAAPGAASADRARPRGRGGPGRRRFAPGRGRAPAALEWRDASLPLVGRVRAALWLPTILLAACAVALVYLAETSGVATTGYDIQRLQAERSEWQLRNEQLKLELAKLHSLAWVEAEATTRLGMQRPAQVTHLKPQPEPEGGR